MIKIDQIRYVEFELSSYCNASCPLCPRNLFGNDSIDLGYTKRHLTLENIKKIITPDLNKQITGGTFCGNFGDPIMNPELLEIVKYLDFPIKIATNASMQTEKFWKELAKENVTVIFKLDGLEDTHHLYRRKTNFNKIIKNAKTFIAAGGDAIWSMIKFDHNKHQIGQCQELSKQMGFNQFEIVDHGRDTGPVFNDNGELEYIIGNYTGSLDFEYFKSMIQNNDVADLSSFDPLYSIECETLTQNKIYVSSNGEIFPCCFMAFDPGKFKSTSFHNTVGGQILKHMKNNNALENSLEECLKWFETIPACWQAKDYNSGRMLICDRSCGKKRKATRVSLKQI